MKPKNRSRLTLMKKTTGGKGLYLCDCGIVKEINNSNVNREITKSCGCIGRDYPSHTTHGLGNHPLYYRWNGMKSRCYNPANEKYPRYGGRGVIVCPEWLSDFKTFYDWAIANGWKDGMQIDKDIKGNGLLYSPETCLIVTNKQNCNKRSHTVLVAREGRTQSIIQWCEEVGINKSTFYSRLNTGWSFEKALTTPKQGTNKRVIERI